MKRSGRFYRRNEAEVMQSLGLKPTINSGSTWMEKEDGQSDTLICQLKSTDAQSITVKQKDIRTLEYNAAIAHKLPIFAIQFLNTGEVWLMAKPADFTEIADYLNTGKKPETIEQGYVIEIDEKMQEMREKAKIVSTQSAREQFYEAESKKYKRSKSAK